EMDYASVEAGDGGKKRYHITDAGRVFLKENKASVDAAMARMEQASKMYARMAAPMAIREAVHTLRHALRVHPWTPAEARRVIGILKRTADEIVSGRGKD
ncbi:MAG TPA: PadR family transcriptional regulator, partial [Rhodanobacteraceae bacterium]|nr:PadR family transcriptional regulator [Rhodanobacteraceae bacterium]